MNLNRFRDIANEKTAHITMTAQLYDNILFAMRNQKPKKNIGAIYAVAACLVVMALSAGALAVGNWNGWFAGGQGGEKSNTTLLAKGNAGETESTADLAGLDLESVLTVKLSPSIKAEGILPKQDEETGLWGYADETGEWVVPAQYAQAYPIKGLTGRVVTIDGEEFLVSMRE